ncbi:RNA polymerase sigma factor [Agrobacterium burrii]|uniref:Sigma-70 family RNA polymerase sigma factor n=1 Tax=Agrobacterium burrii TaxID=2815339 RepID=A0ABS3ENS4_9HYPH|nr:sigma-70 family RNA polymerase sigma factor [Agrobacterium burrii]MBO0133652.1 sigma-70 family RNA polymerase sigma factor [Agrobacterium burrii]
MWSKPTSRARIDDAVQLYYEELCKAMNRRGHTTAISQEIVHDLYVRLTGKPRLPENTSLIRAFLVRACANLGIDRRRREQFERRLLSGSMEEALAAPQPVNDADSLADREHRLKVLRRAVMSMSLQRRQVFLANSIGNLNSVEIAARSGISKNMVDRHLRKAYLHCLDCLEETL